MRLCDLATPLHRNLRAGMPGSQEGRAIAGLCTGASAGGFVILTRGRTSNVSVGKQSEHCCQTQQGHRMEVAWRRLLEQAICNPESRFEEFYSINCPIATLFPSGLVHSKTSVIVLAEPASAASQLRRSSAEKVRAAASALRRSAAGRDGEEIHRCDAGRDGSTAQRYSLDYILRFHQSSTSKELLSCANRHPRPAASLSALQRRYC